MVKPRRLLVLAAALLVAASARAHEFWLEPRDFHPAPDGRLVAEAKVGQSLEGEILGYYPDATVHFDLTRGDDVAPATGEVGQIPVADVPLLGDGLHILRFQSANYQVTYPTLEKFTTFLEEWDQTWALDAHAANEFPLEDIREVYFRYAKALVDVGSGSGADRNLGMPLELIALDNPYADPASDAIAFELSFQDAPLADATVKVFRRTPGGEVELIKLRTDAEGRVRVPRAPGFHLVNAVHLDLASPRMQMFLGASWQSLWASATYEIE